MWFTSGSGTTGWTSTGRFTTTWSSPERTSRDHPDLPVLPADASRPGRHAGLPRRRGRTEPRRGHAHVPAARAARELDRGAPIMPSEQYIRRRAMRNRVDAADRTIEQWEQRLREAHTGAMPSMEPTNEELSA